MIGLDSGTLCDVPALSGAFSFNVTGTGNVHLSGRLERKRTMVSALDLTTGNPTGLLQGRAENVDGIAYSPDGSRIATAGRDSLCLWNAATPEKIVQLQGHSSLVWSPTYRPDDSQLTSDSGDRTVQVWDRMQYQDRFARRRRRKDTLMKVIPIVHRAMAEADVPNDVLRHILDRTSLD